jgi:hypothetical protein
LPLIPRAKFLEEELGCGGAGREHVPTHDSNRRSVKLRRGYLIAANEGDVSTDFDSRVS